eukprot:339613_1
MDVFQSSIICEHSSFLSVGKIIATKYQRKVREENNDNSCRMESMSAYKHVVGKELEGQSRAVQVRSSSVLINSRLANLIPKFYYDGIEETNEAKMKMKISSNECQKCLAG